MYELAENTIIKIYFKNGTTAEGIVISWSEKLGVLRAMSGENKLIIYEPTENIMMIQVSYDHVSVDVPAPTPLVERSRNIARQHMDKIQNDKIAIARSLNARDVRDTSKDGRYELPDFSQHRSIVSSSKKTR